MSRIGKKLIPLTEGVSVEIKENYVEIKGKNGEDKVYFNPAVISVEKSENTLEVKRANDEKHTKQLHGTTRALLANAITGCTTGFVKELEIVGIGYRAEMKGNDIVLHVGYSHPITISPLEGVKIECKDTTHVLVKGSNLQKVGQTAALIRETRKPEPYGGKGIRYKGEFILRKEGKRAGKK